MTDTLATNPLQAPFVKLGIERFVEGLSDQVALTTGKRYEVEIDLDDGTRLTLTAVRTGQHKAHG